MRTSCRLLVRGTSFTPAEFRNISGSVLQGSESAVPLSVKSFSSSAAAATEFWSGISSMYLSSSSSFSSCFSSSAFLASRHLLSSSVPCSSRVPDLHTLVDAERRSSRRKRGVCGSVDVETLLHCSFPSSFWPGSKFSRFSLSCRRSCVCDNSVNCAQIESSNVSSSVSSTVFENEVLEYSSALSPSAAYVHLPFCRRRCFYCDFPIVALGERTEATKGHVDSTMSNYVDLVCKEIAITAARCPKGAATPLKSIFFGGGTPSLLPVPLLARIIDELKCHFQVASDAEISMEMDPGTFDRGKLAGFLGSGITRVSLGVQSFQDELLKACGRAHGLQEVYDAVEAIHSNGLKNWSLDLIASLPNQTSQQWEHSLKEAISLNPAHVSVYDLQIEEGTLFNTWFKAGKDPLPSDEKSAELYSTASRKLREAGFEHYEVSNYARPGFKCRHNLVYWENRPYHAFGLGSTSYNENRRFSRPRKLQEYAKYVQNLEASSSETTDFPQLSPEDQVLDTVMLSLRLARGLNLTEFEDKFGLSITASLCNGLAPFVEKGLVEVMDAQGETISSGMYIQNWKKAKVDLDNFLITVATKELTLSNGSLAQGSIEQNTSCLTMETPRNLRGYASRRRAAFVRLTDPDGFLLSNEVISSIFAALPSGGSI